MTDLNWAKQHISTCSSAYTTYNNYYNGYHANVFGSYDLQIRLGELFRKVFKNFRDNLCPVVVDTFSDRLQLAGFSTTDNAANELINSIWTMNRMDGKSGLIHADALKLGDAYVIVWSDAKGNPKLYRQKPDQIAVRYDDESENIVEAIKVWSTADSYIRLTRYLPDRTERYISKTQTKVIPESLAQFTPYDLDGDAVIANPYNQVPVFRFANDSDSFASSELKNVIPIQDSLNWQLIYMMIGAEFLSLPQRWVTGLELMYDPTTGKPLDISTAPGSIWQIQSSEAKLGQFESADLKQFLEIQDSLRSEIARVSRTPLHAFMLNSGDFPSGQALRTAEAPLLGKVKDRQVSFGNSWEDMMSFACRIKGVEVEDISANWIDTTPNNAKEQSEIALNLKALGVSTRQILKEMYGYTDEQIDQMNEDNQAETAALANRALMSFDNAGA